MEIVSTMGSGSIGRELDLEEFVRSLEIAVDHSLTPSYDDPGMITVRLQPEGVTYVFYRSGGFLIMGAEDKADLDAAQEQLLTLCDEIDLQVSDYSFKQKTAVFMEDFDRRIDLERMIIELGLEHTEYEPEQFPALIYKPPDIDVTIMIFSSGNLIISGTKREHIAQRAIDHLTQQVSETTQLV